MGIVVYLCNSLRCLRCGNESEAWIQTKLLRNDADNCGRVYRVGDSEIVDGIEDYCALHPWDGSGPLAIAVGDWSCVHCSLAWQWAKLVLTANQPQTCSLEFSATIRELSPLVPWRASDLTGIHFVESWLAECSGLWGKGTDYNWSVGQVKWDGLPVDERCERVASGFRSWYREVAEKELPGSIP